MTTINCSADCIYQKDGKCCYEKVLPSFINLNGDCAYFTKIYYKD